MNSSSASAAWREIYRVDALPIFQNRMFDSPEEAKACTKGDIVLVQDSNTGLIFNSAFKPELMLYDAHYQNEQAVSTIFRQHLAIVAQLIDKHFCQHSIIEVGCGKGHFLEQLQASGFKVTGFDPTYEGDNSAIVKEYFSSSIGLRADGIVLRHVLEHVEDPQSFLSTISEANGGGGKIYIEVPCFDWICSHRAWFDIFYEHVNYFRLVDFYRLFGTVYEAGNIFGGQYLYVVADLASLRKPSDDKNKPFEFPQNFLSGVARYAALMKQARKQFAIWGGASKGVTFALLMQRAGLDVDVVIDINPAKQGKYLPATGLQVQSPEQALQKLEADADIIVMNGNYLPEIMAMTQNRFNYISVDHEDI